MTKSLHSFYLLSYRFISLLVLSFMIVGVICYAAMVAFFAGNASWGAPVLLSPSQTRVLSFQSHIAELKRHGIEQKSQHEILGSQIDLAAVQRERLSTLLTRFDAAESFHAKGQRTSSSKLNSLVISKNRDIQLLDEGIVQARQRIDEIEEHLNAGLITAEQAMSEKTGFLRALTESTNAKIALLDLSERSRDASTEAQTLTGNQSNSLDAINVLKQSEEIRVNLETLDLRIAELQNDLAATEFAKKETDRLLQISRTSPLYDALSHESTVVFVPYSNLDEKITAGTEVFDCVLKIVFCQAVGQVDHIYDSEEYARHPIFRSDLKGLYLRVKFSVAEAAKSDIVFVSGKPLFI